MQSQLTTALENGLFNPLLQKGVQSLRSLPQSPMRSIHFSPGQVRNVFFHTLRHEGLKNAVFVCLDKENWAGDLGRWYTVFV